MFEDGRAPPWPALVASFPSTMTTDPGRGTRRQRVTGQPTITTASGRRVSCYPASVFAFIVDSWDRVLLLRHQGQPGWEVVNGPLEPGETVPNAVVREVREQAGPEFLATYLGVLDTFTFAFDANHPPLISICCLLRHRGGEVRPGRDLREAEFRWWELSELDNIALSAPRGRWDLLARAVDLSHYLRDARVLEEDARGDSPEFL